MQSSVQHSNSAPKLLDSDYNGMPYFVKHNQFTGAVVSPTPFSNSTPKLIVKKLLSIAFKCLLVPIKIYKYMNYKSFTERLCFYYKSVYNSACRLRRAALNRPVIVIIVIFFVVFRYAYLIKDSDGPQYRKNSFIDSRTEHFLFVIVTKIEPSDYLLENMYPIRVVVG